MRTCDVCGRGLDHPERGELYWLGVSATIGIWTAGRLGIEKSDERAELLACDGDCGVRVLTELADLQQRLRAARDSLRLPPARPAFPPDADKGAAWLPPVPVCASCVRPGERVRGCRNGRELAPCARCGQPTTGRRVDG